MKYSFVLIVTLFGFIVPKPNAPIEKIQAIVKTRKLEAGKSYTVSSEIYFNSNGNSITHLISPLNYFIISNKLGETKIYDPKNNTALVETDDALSSKTNYFYYFLFGKTSDMGLNDLNFAPIKTSILKDKAVVTEFKPKFDNKTFVTDIKLVHKNNNPIYLEYKSGIKILRKVYYSNYIALNKKEFPQSITDIVFNQKNPDSIISKTTFSDIKINENATNPNFDFKVPANAKKLN